MSTLQPFSPALSTPLAVTTASQNLPFDPNAVADQVRLLNATTGLIYFRFTNDPTATVSTANGCPMMQGTAEVFTKGDSTRIAIIGAVAGNVFATTGSGV